MCLKSKNLILENREAPIECYKVLCVWKDKEGYWSPTFVMQYEIGEEYVENMFAGEYDFKSCGDGYNKYYKGFHVCLTYDGANEYLDMMVENSDEDDVEFLEALVIAKCEVPVGGCYCIGEDECSGIEALICNKFKINEIVNRFDKIAI